jgi:hypothetical protein
MVPFWNVTPRSSVDTCPLRRRNYSLLPHGTLLECDAQKFCRHLPTQEKKLLSPASWYPSTLNMVIKNYPEMFYHVRHCMALHKEKSFYFHSNYNLKFYKSCNFVRIFCNADYRVSD